MQEGPDPFERTKAKSVALQGRRGDEMSVTNRPERREEADAILAACPFKDAFDAARDISSVDRLIETLREVKAGAFWAEAVIDGWVQMGRDQRGDLEKLEAAKLGIHLRHPLHGLRQMVLDAVERAGRASTDEALVLWGAAGDLPHAINRFMRSAPVQAYLASHAEADVEALALAWLKACGRHQHRREGAAVALIREIALYMTPRVRDVPVDEATVRLAAELAEGDEKRALVAVRVFSRIVAYTRHGKVAWRSWWIEGPAKAAKSGDPEGAIRGASTPTTKAWIKDRVLPRVLHQVRGHSAGRRSAMYEVVAPLAQGIYGAEHERTRSLIAALMTRSV